MNTKPKELFSLNFSAKTPNQMSLFPIFEPLLEKLVGRSYAEEARQFLLLYKIVCLTFWTRSKAICFPRGPWFVVRKFWKKKYLTFYTLHYLQIFRITRLHVPWNIRLKCLQEKTPYHAIPFFYQYTNLALSSSLRSIPHATAQALRNEQFSRVLLQYRFYAASGPSFAQERKEEYNIECLTTSMRAWHRDSRLRRSNVTLARSVVLGPSPRI